MVDPRIELDCSAVSSLQFEVSLIAPLLHPFGEVITHSGVDHIADVAPWHFPYLSRDRERISNDPIAQSEFHDGVHREIVVLWHRNDLHIVTVNCLQNE